MLLHSIADLAKLDTAKQYDLAFYASGFEQRSCYIARKLGQQAAKRNMVFGFSEHRDVLSRRNNDRFFEDEFGCAPVLASEHSDDTKIYEHLRGTVNGSLSEIRILVDYSVMTRSWYASILNWLRLANGNAEVIVDFIYVHGNYLSEYDPLQITEVSSVDGFEGIIGGKNKTTAFFGLGFDKYATLAVYERIEPDDLICFIASKGAESRLADRVRSQNREILAMARREAYLPLGSVEEQFRVICEYLEGADTRNQLALVPMGPKPLCLAALLACLRYRGATCLYAKGKRGVPVDVEARDDLTATRVRFTASQ